MTPEENKIIRDVFDRLKAMGPAPRDPDAERLIKDQISANSEAPVALVRAVVLLDRERVALVEERARLQQRISDLETGARAASQSGGMFNSGPARPGGPWGQAGQTGAWDPSGQPNQGQGGYGGPWGNNQAQAPQQGGGFLTGALSAAAGVAGGLFAFEAIRGLFGGHGGGYGSGFGGFGGGYGGPSETIVEQVTYVEPDRFSGGSSSDGFETGGFLGDSGGFADGGSDDSFA